MTRTTSGPCTPLSVPICCREKKTTLSDRFANKVGFFHLKKWTELQVASDATDSDETEVETPTMTCDQSRSKYYDLLGLKLT